jgi:hypothetical protein
VTFLALLSPVVVVAAGLVVLGQTLSTTQLVGVLVVLLSIIVAQHRSQHTHAGVSQPLAAPTKGESARASPQRNASLPLPAGSGRANRQAEEDRPMTESAQEKRRIDP